MAVVVVVGSVVVVVAVVGVGGRRRAIHLLGHAVAILRPFHHVLMVLRRVLLLIRAILERLLDIALRLLVGVGGRIGRHHYRTVERTALLHVGHLVAVGRVVWWILSHLHVHPMRRVRVTRIIGLLW